MISSDIQVNLIAKRCCIYLLLLFSVSISLQAAAAIKVVDAQTGEALVGVNITLVGTNEGLNTDLNGRFELSPRYADQELKFSYIGYLDTTLSYAALQRVETLAMKPDVINLGSVEVISSKLEWEQTDLPSIVTVLRTRDLVEQGSVEIKEVLQRDPSVVIDESANGVHEISIRGSNADEVLIIYDGIPLNSAYAGGFDLTWLDLNDIESVSIIKGGGTLRYGSGAFGGVVVIEPLINGSSGLTLNAQQNDRGLRSFSLSDMLQIGRFRSRVTYSTREHLPFGYFNDQIISRRDFLNLHSNYALRDTANVISINHVDISEKVEPNINYVNQYTDQYSQFKYSGSVGPLPNLTLQILRRNNDSEQMNHMANDFHYDYTDQEQTDLIIMENKWVHKAFVNFIRLESKQNRYESLSATTNIFWDHLDEHKINLDQAWRAATEIFKYRTDIEVPFVDYLELNTSLRYDRVDLSKAHKAFRDSVQYSESESDLLTTQLSKRNGFTLNKSRQNMKYQFFYSSGTSLGYPSMQDLYLREVTTIVAYMDTTLLPELNSSSEVGFQATYQPALSRILLQTLDLQVSLFRNRYMDKIYYRQIPRALPTPINFSGVTELNGYELSLMASFYKDHLRLFAGTSRIDISSYTMFPNKPEFKDVVEVELGGKVGNFRAQYFHEGQQYYTGTMDNINYEVVELAGRENVNLYASLKLDLEGKNYIVGVTALNILSDENETSYLEQQKWMLNLGISL